VEKKFWTLGVDVVLFWILQGFSALKDTGLKRPNHRLTMLGRTSFKRKGW